VNRVRQRGLRRFFPDAGRYGRCFRRLLTGDEAIVIVVI
jgi:hypothetical protein